MRRSRVVALLASLVGAALVTAGVLVATTRHAGANGTLVELPAGQWPSRQLLGTPARAVYRLPAGIRPWHYGSHATDRYVVFGVEAPLAGAGGPRQPPDQHGRYAVIDRRTGRLAVHPSVGLGVYTDINLILEASNGEYLVRVETHPEKPTDCPASPDNCWSWQMYQQLLPSGTTELVTRSTTPGPDAAIPEPRAGGGYVVWQSGLGSGSQVVEWRPGSAVRVLARGYPMSVLSVSDGGAYIGVPASAGRPSVTRIDLASGSATTSDLPVTSALPTVSGTTVAYVTGEDTATKALHVADLSAPRSARALLTSQDFYNLGWVGSEHLVASTLDGYVLVDVSTGKATALPVNPLYGIQDDDSHMTITLDDAGTQDIVVVQPS